MNGDKTEAPKHIFFHGTKYKRVEDSVMEHGEKVGRQHARNKYVAGETMDNPYPVKTSQNRGFELEMAEILFEEHVSSTYAQDEDSV